MILAVDPGETVGVADWNGHAFRSWEISGGLHAGVVGVRQILPLYARLVLEDFEITASTVRKDLAGAYTTLHQIGGIKIAAHEAAVPVTMQRPSDQNWAKANNWATLRAIGWYSTAGDGHCNSAAAHLLKYLLDHRALPANILDPLMNVEFEL